jgi:hypothetical protein
MRSGLPVAERLQQAQVQEVEQAMNLGYLVERFFGLALMLLVGAIAVDIGVHIIQSVWVVLVIIFGFVGLVSGIIWWIRSRDQGW